MGDQLRIAGPIDAPIGMRSIKSRELHQLFVAPAARRKGVAARLLADAEQRLLAQGDTFAFLDCLIENDAAVRFYSRHGWVKHGVQIAQWDTLDGPFDLPCLTFRKELLAQ
jgi:GNAT superfamily N-acetyltransferase